MTRGKFANAAPTRVICAALALVLVLCGAIGGTVAWLIAQADPVTNVFTYGDINIDLEEDGMEPDGDGFVNEYEMIPGNDLEKDPTVTVKAGSEACYLFVTLTKSENFDDFLTYEMADGWVEMDDGDGDDKTMLYCREVDATDADMAFEVIKNNTVHVKEEVTKEMLNALDEVEGEETYPTLTIAAYAVQQANIDTAADAWSYVVAQNTPAEPETPAAPETPAEP